MIDWAAVDVWLLAERCACVIGMALLLAWMRSLGPEDEKW